MRISTRSAATSSKASSLEVDVVADTAIRMIAAMAVIMPNVSTQPSLFPRIDDTMRAGMPARNSAKHVERMRRSDMALAAEWLVLDAVRLIGR